MSLEELLHHLIPRSLKVAAITKVNVPFHGSKVVLQLIVRDMLRTVKAQRVITETMSYVPMRMLLRELYKV